MSNLRATFLLLAAVMLSACASLSNTRMPTHAPEVNGYMLTSRTSAYADGRTSTTNYTLDPTVKRIYDDNGDYYDFDEYGAVSKLIYGRGDKSRTYIRDRDLRIIRKNGIVSGKKNIDTIYEYKNSKLVSATDIYPSGRKLTLLYQYDENGQLGIKRWVHLQGKGCSFTSGPLAGSNSIEVMYNCDSGAYGRYHVDNNGNIFVHFRDSIKENAGLAKLNISKISYQYKATSFPVPNITLLRLMTSVFAAAPLID